MKCNIIITCIILFQLNLFANSGPERSIEVYTKSNCSGCTTAVNFLKKNWGPVSQDNVPEATVVYPISNSENRKNLESLFYDYTDLSIKDIKFPVIIMRNAGEPFPVYYNIVNVEDLLKCKLNTGSCRNTSYKSGTIRYGTYGEILTLDDNTGSSSIKTFTNPDGSEYTGQMKNGKMHGQGILKYSDGSVYTGMMRDGKRNGHGTLLFANGDNYDGQWKNDLMEGFGTFKWTDGSWYQGGYKKGKYNGRGTLTTNGKSYEQQYGIFKNGKFIGN